MSRQDEVDKVVEHVGQETIVGLCVSPKRDVAMRSLEVEFAVVEYAMVR